MRVIVERVRTAKGAYELSQRAGVAMPIVAGVYRILDEHPDRARKWSA